MTVMRIAIAGSGGVAQHIAHFLDETEHLFVILSRTPKPSLVSLGYQVVDVDYESQRDLSYALRGVDLVISTIAGSPQINLIDASAAAGVRRFVPSEFEGLPSRRPSDSPFDDGRSAALNRLREIADGPTTKKRRAMQFTTFSCGVFYERFARGGLASKGVAIDSGWEHQGAFMLDVGANRAEVIQFDVQEKDIKLCMTSLRDVGCFVASAVGRGLGTWPEEFRMRGDRKSVQQIIGIAENVKNTRFTTYNYTPNELAQLLHTAIDYQDHPRTVKLQLLAAALGKQYDFSRANLNDLVDHEPENFKDWLKRQWGVPPP